MHPVLPTTNINYVEEMIAFGERIRCPVADGVFYPEDSTGVLAFIKGIGLKRGKGGQARAVIAPHGAWSVSGKLAGTAFADAAGRYGENAPSRVVIMGPIHDKREKGLFLTNSHSFITPLGGLPVDVEYTDRLELYSPLFQVDDIPHLQEHSIEVLLPFVKYCFPHTAIVPILMGKPNETLIHTLACALRDIFSPVMEDTLLVVSFNMTEYKGEEEALNMAWECLRLFNEGRSADLCKALQNGWIISCGGALVAALLQSGLVDTDHPRPVSLSLERVFGEKGRTVYYNALSFS